MSVSTPEKLSRYIRKKKNVLMLAGYQCDEMELGNRRLSDYAVDIALMLNIPVAATGNSLIALREKGVDAHKRVALELLEQLRHEGWRDPVMEQRPDLVLFIGYPKDVARGLVSSVRDVNTVVLGNAETDEATFCFPDASLKDYKNYLDQLLKGLGA